MRGRRQVRDRFETPAMTLTILRGILSHKIFEHVQNFRDYFAPLGDTCEEITNRWRLFRDCFATHSRCLSPAVAKQSQSSEIGALAIAPSAYDLSCLWDNYKLWYEGIHKHFWLQILPINSSENRSRTIA